MRALTCIAHQAHCVRRELASGNGHLLLRQGFGGQGASRPAVALAKAGMAISLIADRGWGPRIPQHIVGSRTLVLERLARAIRTRLVRIAHCREQFGLIRLFTILAILIPSLSYSEELKTGDPAPLFTLRNQDGVDFSLADRKGKGWTVLYFYPRAGTPGCTREACAFRDAIEKIKSLHAEVFGISSDTVEDQKAFHAEHKLRFDLLADPEMQVIRQYEAKMPLLGMAKRWTFIIDPDLKIRSIEKDVDPMLDATRVAEALSAFQGGSR